MRLVADPDFALDPTDPRFRAAEGAAHLAAEVAKRKSERVTGAAAAERGPVPKAQAAGTKSASEDQTLLRPCMVSNNNNIIINGSGPSQRRSCARACTLYGQAHACMALCRSLALHACRASRAVRRAEGNDCVAEDQGCTRGEASQPGCWPDEEK